MFGGVSAYYCVFSPWLCCLRSEKYCVLCVMVMELMSEPHGDGLLETEANLFLSFHLYERERDNLLKPRFNTYRMSGLPVSRRFENCRYRCLGRKGVK
jgi:hypothetical protein